MSPKRFWGIFTIAISMFLLNLFSAALLNSPVGIFTASMWAVVAIYAFQGKPAFIQHVAFMMAAIEAAIAFFLFYNQNQISDRQLQSMVGLSLDELLMGSVISVSLWLGVALRASHLKTLVASPASSSEDAKQSADPAYKYVPREKHREPPQRAETTRKAMPAAASASADVRISSQKSPSEDTSARKATTPAEMEPMRTGQPYTAADDPKNVDRVSADKTEAAADQPPEDAKIDLGNFPKAQVAIEYRPEVEEAWSQAQALPTPYMRRFLETMNEDPKLDVQGVLTALKQEFEREQRPYASDQLNEALAKVRDYGPEIEEEFRRVVGILGEAVQVDDVISRLEEKFAEQIRVRTHNQ